MIEKKFWSPSLTTQFMVCPIPYHMDTYRGCTYNCRYCFARDFVCFSRRKAEHKEFSYLIGNRADLLKNWIERTMKAPYNYNKGEEVALKERIPIKIGATADPFPFVEVDERVTYDILKVFHEYDYPVEIQTKNPAILATYADEFENPNWSIAVTLISTDEKFVKVCEPSAMSPKKRLSAIKKLTDMGLKVMVKCQPAIYPKIMGDLPDLVKSIKEAGCWAFNTEGLKVRISMPVEEQKIFQEVGDYLGINLRETYKEEAKTGSDWELSNEKKMEYTRLAESLAKQYDIKYFSADNRMGKVGDGCECCGTQALRNYKIWGGSDRSKVFGASPNDSKELGKCQVNFCRSTKYLGKTMDEVAKIDPKPTQKVKILHNTYGGFGEDHPRESTDLCPTIRTPTGGGHIPCVQIEEAQSTGSIRRLTPMECERLQGFEDNWTAKGTEVTGTEVTISDTQRYKTLGNAVTVNVIEAVITRMFKTEEEFKKKYNIKVWKVEKHW